MAERKTQDEFKHDSNPIKRPDFTWADVHALKALQRGTANKQQQQRALDYIILHVCRTYDTPYRVTARETDVMIGRIAAGQDIVHFLNMRMSAEDLDKISVREHFAQLGDEANEQTDDNADQPEDGGASG